MGLERRETGAAALALAGLVFYAVLLRASPSGTPEDPDCADLDYQRRRNERGGRPSR